ncbi:uncharacterized protein LOC109285436 [Alligator mississippiensis]|uniref:uncharacterized protein LOC109285436 n=1 Tax=Alligator mississippiensis TaxID=8496 RepID=UPI0028775E86|nr:uncharacterized protein LOC109285436 [Alligator mississippiensis]
MGTGRSRAGNEGHSICTRCAGKGLAAGVGPVSAPLPLGRASDARDGADVLPRCNVPCRGCFDLLGAVVNWQLPGEPSAVVDSFFHGQARPEHQDARYRGRTQLFPGEFAEGNASLLLTGTTPGDAGNYSCPHKTKSKSKSMRRRGADGMAVLAGAVLTQIVVCILAGQGRGRQPEWVLAVPLCPSAGQTSSRVTARDGADVLLRCNVPCRGHFDFLGAIVNWQLPGEPSAVVDSFFHGQVHPEHQDARYRGRTQLFPGEFAKGNASLLLRGTTPSDAGNYSCHAVLCAHTPHTQRVVELQVTGLAGGGTHTQGTGLCWLLLLPMLLFHLWLLGDHRELPARLHFKSCWEPGPGALQHWQLIQDKRSLGWQPAVCSAPQMPVLAPCMTGRFNSPGSLESQDPSAHRKTWTGFAFIHTSVQMGKAGLDAAGRKKEKNQLSIAGNAGVLIRPINKGSL